MNLNKFIKNFRFNNVNFKSLNFFTKDKNYFNLYLKVLENHYDNNKDYSIEKFIISMISNQVSRPTIFKIIERSLSKKFLLKEQNKNDKRKYILVPSQQTIKEFEEWAKLFKNL